MVITRFRDTPIGQRYVAAFAVTAVLTLLASGVITAGVVTAEGLVFALIGRRHVRLRRLADQ